MGGMQIAAIVILALIILPIPLAWAVGAAFPSGYQAAHTARIKDFARREWPRILLCGAVMVLMFIFAPDNALHVTLIGAAILIGRFIAVMRKG